MHHSSELSNMEQGADEPLREEVERTLSRGSKASWWIQRNVLVREVFYVQTVLILTLVIASIANIARGQTEDQIWVTYLALGIGLLIPSPKVKSSVGKSETNTPEVQPKKTNFMQIWHKRTSQSRELFYVQALVLTLIIVTSIVNLSIESSSRQVWVVVLSASYGNILPSPKFGKKKS